MFNYSSAPQTFYVAIASGGVLWQQKYQLAALETKTLDIGSLIATGAKDESGLVLPAAATAGVAQWFTPNFGQGAGRLLVSQPGIGLARNFGCQIMAVLGGTSSMLNNNVTIAAGTSGQMGPYQADCYLGRVGFCGGTYNMTAPWSTNWTSSNPSVASIPTPSGPTTATIDGNTAGSAGITAAGINQEYNVEGQEWWCTAPPQQGTVTVTPPTEVSITSSQTTVPMDSSGLSGVSTSITVTAQGSPSGGTYSWGTTSGNVTLTNASSATVTVTGKSASTSASDTPLTVTYTANNSPATASTSLTVAQPTSLSQSNGAPVPGGFPCSPYGMSCATTLQPLTYTVNDQFGHQYGPWNMYFSEVFSNWAGNCGPARPTPSQQVLTNVIGFIDGLGICSSTCPQCTSNGAGCTETATQVWSVNGYAVRTNSVNWTCTACSASGN